MCTNNCNCNCKVVGSGFRPTENELVFHYLLNKVNGDDRLTSAIAEVDLLEYEPWELPQRSAAQSKLQLWYFFYQLDHKYRNSKRANRLTKAGYWKGTGQGRTIKAADTNEKFASVKSLVFHKGRVPNAVRTNWMIHEYRLIDAVFPPNGRAYVVCCLEKRPVGKNSTQHKGELGSSSASTSHSKAADYAFTEGGPELNAPNNELAVQIQDQGISLEANGLSNTHNGMQEHGPLENDMLSNGFTVEQNAWQAPLDTVEQDEASVERNASSSMILAQGGTQSQANPEPLAGNNTLDYELATQMQEVPLEPDGLSNYQNAMQEHGPFYNDLFIGEPNGWQAQMDTIEQDEASVERNASSSMILAQGGPWSQANPEEPLDGYKVLVYEPPAQMQEQGISLDDLELEDIFSNEFTLKQNVEKAQLDTIEQDEEFVSSISVDGDEYSHEGTLNVPLCNYGLAESWRKVCNNESSETVTEMSNLQNQPVGSKRSWQNHLENDFDYEEFPNFGFYGDDLVAASPNDPNFLNTITCNSLNQPRQDNSLAEEGPRSFQLQCEFPSKETVFKDKARDVELLESSFSYKHKSKRLKTHSDENFYIS